MANRFSTVIAGDLQPGIIVAGGNGNWSAANQMNELYNVSVYIYERLFARL